MRNEMRGDYLRLNITFPGPKKSFLPTVQLGDPSLMRWPCADKDRSKPRTSLSDSSHSSLDAFFSLHHATTITATITAAATPPR